MTRGKHSPIGLDIGARWIKALQISRTGRDEQVCAAVRLRRAAATPELGHDEADALLGVLHRRGFVGSRAVLSASHEKLVRHAFELPPRDSGAPVAMLARAELARTGRIDPNAMEMCWWETPACARSTRGGAAAESGGGGPGGAPVYALGMSHADAGVLVDTLEDAGLAVVAIDAPTTACARAAAQSPQYPALGGLILVEIGWSTVCIAAFAEGVPVYERLLEDSGIGRVVSRVITELKVSPEVAEHIVNSTGRAPQPAAQAPEPETTDRRQEPELLGVARKLISAQFDTLFDEIRASVSYAARRFAGHGGGGAASPTVFVGGGCGVAGVADRIESAFGQTARALAPDACVPFCPSAAHASADPSFMCALGLALHDGSHPGDAA